jgi:hypothetical protein
MKSARAQERILKNQYTIYDDLLKKERNFSHKHSKWLIFTINWLYLPIFILSVTKILHEYGLLVEILNCISDLEFVEIS